MYTCRSTRLNVYYMEQVNVDYTTNIQYYIHTCIKQYIVNYIRALCENNDQIDIQYIDIQYIDIQYIDIHV